MQRRNIVLPPACRVVQGQECILLIRGHLRHGDRDLPSICGHHGAGGRNQASPLGHHVPLGQLPQAAILPDQVNRVGQTGHDYVLFQGDDIGAHVFS